MRTGLIIAAYFGLYLIFNTARLIRARMHRDHLRTVFLRSSYWLLGLIIIALGVSYLLSEAGLTTVNALYLAAALQLAAAVAATATTIRHLRTTQAPLLTEHYSDQELPSISVCVPARNETDDLFECLQSLVASTYPKLEILVLDDSSQDKRTPEIIRGFAHDGVRFLQGKTPPDSWLAKNYAYDQMADEANGDILFFTGVDSRYAPDALTNMVSLLLQKKKSMIGFLPKNIIETNGTRGLLVQPARYAWEIALPRRLFRRPPVLSTAWLIRRDVFKAAGGFDAVKRKVVPESYFAKFSAQRDDGYSFVQADAQLDVQSHKTFAEQRSTAVRTRYPQLHKRPEMVALTGLAEIFTLLAPLMTVAIGLLAQEYWLAALAATAYALQLFIYGKMVDLAYRRFLPLGYAALPFAALYDLALLNYSMYKYEFSEVLWKDRDIAVPVMRVIPRLPPA